MNRFLSLLLLIAIAGCSQSPPDDRSDYAVGHRKITVEGHDYLLFRFQQFQGCGVLHSESCPCHQKAERESQ